MTKALIRGELDKEFRDLERPKNSKPAQKNKPKCPKEQLPTNCHGAKKAAKRLKSKSLSLRILAPPTNRKITLGKYQVP